jgi:hypothetical protein
MKEVGETVFRALLEAAGPTGSINVAFRIFPEHVEVDVLHSDEPGLAAGCPTASEPEERGAIGATAPAALRGPAQPATFADWMASALRREGLTQEAAARQLGVSVKTVSRWVGGATEPRMRDLRRIQEVFGELPLV